MSGAVLLAAELREAFDRAFAEPARQAAVGHVDLLAIRIGSAPFALRLGEIAAIAADRVVTPVPTSMPSLLGLAGFRGALIPVHDLRTLIGAPASAPPRWIVLAAGSPLGFAFDHFERYLRVAPGDLAVTAADGAHRRAVVTGAEPRAVLDLASLRATVERQARALISQETAP